MARVIENATGPRPQNAIVCPPGVGKTLLARAIRSILPRMTIDGALDVTRIYSVADQFPATF